VTDEAAVSLGEDGASYAHTRTRFSFGQMARTASRAAGAMRHARAMNVDDLQHALGGVVIESAYLEQVLRASLGALTGSKYTAAIDGRIMAHALIEDCRHIARVHTDITESAKAALIGALDDCDAANRKRNRVIHDAWAYRTGDIMITLQDQRGPQDITTAAGTVDELTDLAGQIEAAAATLSAAVTNALGADSLRIEDQLRLELGHSVNAEIG
jgi:hypothetical protein